MNVSSTARTGLVAAALLVGGAILGPSNLTSPAVGGEAPGAAAPIAAGPVAAGPVAAAQAPSRPNVVLVTTDDMRADDLLQMPRTRRLLGRLDLDEFVSNHPLCCPARAELLTGQLGQRNGVHANTGRWGGYDALRGKDNTLARWFNRGGYATALVGKFVNGWCPSTNRRPMGWTDFTPLVRSAYSPYHYFYLDGSRTRPAPRGVHTNDFVTERTLRRIREYAPGSRPFLIWSSYVAPHDMEVNGVFGPPVPAERHRGTLAGVVPTSTSKPSYEQPGAGELARAATADADAHICDDEEEDAVGTARAVRRTTIRQLNQRRLESLLSVDEGIGRMVRTLQRLGELRRTVFVFTSDNGYLLGEHGIVGKGSYYEESLRVPLLARGRAVQTGTSSKGAMITDIGPSLARLGSVAPQRRVDGRADLFAPDGGWRRLLIQSSDETAPWLWRGVRSDRWTYVELQGGRVLLFDRNADPSQRDNVAPREPRVVRQLRRSLRSMTR
jgi:N-acetylglucosamine-6-sulfatase